MLGHGEKVHRVDHGRDEAPARKLLSELPRRSDAPHRHSDQDVPAPCRQDRTGADRRREVLRYPTTRTRLHQPTNVEPAFDPRTRGETARLPPPENSMDSAAPAAGMSLALQRVQTFGYSNVDHEVGRRDAQVKECVQ
jgi:hypothetical protein